MRFEADICRIPWKIRAISTSRGCRNCGWPDGMSVMSGSKMLWDGLIVGGDSLIGGHLACASRLAGMSVVATSRRPGSLMLSFDLERPDFGIFDGSRFRWAAICAAITNMG